MNDATPTTSPWLTPAEAAARAQLSIATLYREVRRGRLRAARVGGRRKLRFKAQHIDEWLESSVTEVGPMHGHQPD
jgi:excisionase family DNA binding protein